MARQEAWEQEMHDALRHEGWALYGPNRIVKVTPIGRPVAQALRGFVCLEKVLFGKTPYGIEGVLGLPPGSLLFGCRVYRFLRLPMTSEVEYELTAKHPDGLAFNPASSNPMYPPGSPAAHQWRLLVDVPVERLLDLPTSSRYSYSHA
jgi:hypothetical protein